MHYKEKIYFIITGIIIILLWVLGFIVHQLYSVKPSNVMLESSETFGEDRYILKMKDSAVVSIFKDWDTTLFTHCEIKDLTIEVSYAPGRDKIALSTIIGGEVHVVDTNYFKIDNKNFKFIFKHKVDTAFIPVRVITQYYNFKKSQH